MRIGILGGTFDPIHKGHLHLAQESLRKLSLDQVLFIPAYLPPHKEGKKREISSASYRYAMVRLAVAGKRRFRVLDLEIKKKRKVYTLETLRALHRLFPESTEFYFLTGADNLQILDRWKNLREICKLCRFVIATRADFKRKKVPSNMVWLPIRPVSISATEIRERIKRGKSFGYLLPPKVAGFIRKKKLYQFRNAS